MLLLLVALAAAGGHPQAASQSAAPLIDMPYVTQTRDLCGGAALTMVMRYWGDRTVNPDVFASLVVPGAGIRTGDMADAVRARAWQSWIVSDIEGHPRERITQELARGRPLIALIQVEPGTYHYVVIVGAGTDRVVYHDPARAPYRSESWREFDQAWTAAGRWLLLVLPPVGDVAAADATVIPAAVTKCSALVARSVEVAGAGDVQAAEQGLRDATQHCPDEAAPWRELAGLRFLASRWTDASDMARQALAREPDDVQARTLLATSLYLAGRPYDALDAWNVSGQPVIDAITVSGAERTRHPVLVDSAAHTIGDVLTSDGLRHAERRVRAVPALADARVTYTPSADGRAGVEARVVEQTDVPQGWLPLAVVGGRALISHTVDAAAIGRLGEGEAFDLSWRWRRHRPRVSAAFAVPAPGVLPGVIRVEALWQRQTYQQDRQREHTRRRFSVMLSDWIRHDVWWGVEVSRDRFDAQSFVSVEPSAVWLGAQDRVAVVGEGGVWLSSSGGAAVGAGSLAITARTSTSARRSQTVARLSGSVVTTDAPLALWPAAGTGAPRPGSLRAHAWLVDDVVAGDAFGRHLVTASVEHMRPLISAFGFPVGAAVFVDVARAWHRAPDMHMNATSPWLTGVGLGVRAWLPTGQAVRADLAWDTRRHTFRVSAGVVATWPR